MNMKKINENHLGWAEHLDGGKDHYYVTNEGVFIISICGEAKSYTHSDECFMNQQSLDVKNNLCKRCLNQIKKFENGEKVKIEVKGMFL